MRFNNQTYDVLKYIALIGLPAIATFVAAIGAIWDLNNTDLVVKSIIAFNVLFSSLIVVKGIQYGNSESRFDGMIDPYYANGVANDEVLNITNVRAAEGKKELVLKVDTSRTRRPDPDNRYDS